MEDLANVIEAILFVVGRSVSYQLPPFILSKREASA